MTPLLPMHVQITVPAHLPAVTATYGLMPDPLADADTEILDRIALALEHHSRVAQPTARSAALLLHRELRRCGLAVLREQP